MVWILDLPGSELSQSSYLLLEMVIFVSETKQKIYKINEFFFGSKVQWESDLLFFALKSNV